MSDDGSAEIGHLAPPDSDDFPAWVERLASPPRANVAFWHLVHSGAAAVPAIRAGLSSTNRDVRIRCTMALDHLVDPDTMSLLISMLTDPEPRVRREALHALACDRCKDNACRADASTVLPVAIDLLIHDDDRHVRNDSIALVGRSVHTYTNAADALMHAATHDPSPSIRKTARWYLPDGPRHRKTAPRGPRGPQARTD